MIYEYYSLNTQDYKSRHLSERERQVELGGEGPDWQDKYLLEINLEDLERSSGEDHYYWLLSNQAAREDRALKVREKQSRRENRQFGERHVSNVS